MAEKHDLIHAYQAVESQQFPYPLLQAAQSVFSGLVHPPGLSPQEPAQVPQQTGVCANSAEAAPDRAVSCGSLVLGLAFCTRVHSVPAYKITMKRARFFPIQSQ